MIMHTQIVVFVDSISKFVGNLFVRPVGAAQTQQILSGVSEGLHLELVQVPVKPPSIN
jgi:hypothetical protein